ncbi:MAG: hypothetical protein QOF76_4892, partial [Solirubrobacteraceae bacterium]|nr:hypothetical protein [Solirubrobacteraceae bacterium]
MRRKKQPPRLRYAFIGILLICVGIYFVFTKRV